MASEEYPHSAYVLALIAGILMVVNGLLLTAASVAFLITAPYAYHVGPYGGFMMYRPFMWPGGIFFGMAAFGLVSGIIVLVSTLMLKKNPTNYTWGVLIIIFSVLSFFGMGGFVVGAILGIIGGALALTWHK